MTEFKPGRRTRRSRALAAGLLALAGVLALSGAALATDPSASPDPGASASPTASPSPSPSASPSPSPTPWQAPPRLAYLRDVGTTGSYVGQYNFVQCVGASVQMMRNMVLEQSDHSPYMQRLLWMRARHWSRYTGDGGADPYGWAAVLTFTSAGSYRAYGGTSLVSTLHAVARAIALSGRPVGITVWHGGHAWVVSGLTATNDPAKTDNFTVLTVSVTDPLWTLLHGRPGIRAPATWLTVAQVAAVFQPYHDAHRDRALEGHYVAILPVPTAAEAALAVGRPALSFGVTGP